MAAPGAASGDLPLVLVKLGGAAITDKARLETLNPAALEATALHIREVVLGPADGPSAGARARLLVVHGAGSFGHFSARKYGVATGGDFSGDARLRHGFALTRAAVRALNGHVVARLIAAGVPATGLSPLDAGWRAAGRRPAPGAVAALAAACRGVWAAGLLPVSHGDAVLDATQGCCIVSGDTLVPALAAELGPVDRAVFLTNVAGVFDRPPEEPGARLVREIRVAPDGSLAAARVAAIADTDAMEAEEASGAAAAAGGAPEDLRLGGAGAGAQDTTGGMAAKVAEAAALTAAGVPVLIAQAGTPAAAAALAPGAIDLSTLRLVATGEAWLGTIIMQARAG